LVEEKVESVDKDELKIIRRFEKPYYTGNI